jgi:glycosyltransferase involved in cell wall biosynthesis
MPNAVLEAMALGKPVVATSVGGVPELIEHGVSGWLTPPREPAALARGLAVVLADAALQQSLAAAARLRVERQFSTERMLAATQAIYARWL